MIIRFVLAVITLSFFTSCKTLHLGYRNSLESRQISSILYDNPIKAKSVLPYSVAFDKKGLGIIPPSNNKMRTFILPHLIARKRDKKTKDTTSKISNALAFNKRSAIAFKLTSFGAAGLLGSLITAFFASFASLDALASFMLFAAFLSSIAIFTGFVLALGLIWQIGRFPEEKGVPLTIGSLVITFLVFAGTIGFIVLLFLLGE